jgi:putative ABC transport system permease protein
LTEEGAYPHADTTRDRAKTLVFGLARRGAWFHRYTYASVLTGTVVSVAVLVGALLVGDCVRYSLRQFALLRLGGVHAAADLRQRFMDEAIVPALGARAGAGISGVLRLKGVVWRQDTRGAVVAQVNAVNVLGVDDAFWQLGGAAAPPLDNDGIVLSGSLAAALGASVGAEVSLRVGQPTLLPRDAPLASRREKLSQSGVFTVRRIADDAAMGRFSLEANQVAPFNAFVARRWLQDRVKLKGRVNLLLAGAGPKDAPAVERLDRALGAAWQIGYAGLSVKDGPDGLLQLESDRVFLDPGAAQAAMTPGAVGVLVYMANTITCPAATGTLQTAYSFVLAATPSTNRLLSPVPPEMRDDEILINRWLADELRAAEGAAVTLSYYELGAAGDFIERSRAFRVRGILPMAALARERALMPEFPGLTDVNSCREWDIGMPTREDLLADKANEDYWRTHRSTPKAVVTLAAGQAMWGSRFGACSAVRYAAPAGGRDALERRLARDIAPASVGLFFMPVRAQALKASTEAMDFGELFLSMSVFLIAAALMLTGLLFVFGVQQRSAEMGTLLAVGFRPAHLRRLCLYEGAWIAAAGAVAGAALGIGYTRLLVYGLATGWKGAVASAAIQFHAEPAHVAAGTAAGFVCAVGAMLAYVWRQARHPARALLAADFTADSGGGAQTRRRPWVAGAVAALGLAGAVACIAAARSAGADHAVEAFFSAGALLLIAGLGGIRLLLARLDAGAGAQGSLGALGVRNASRRLGRSLTAVGLLACGSFMIFAVSAMQENLEQGSTRRGSGTGGFALFAQSTLPAPDPLDSAAARKAFRLDAEPALAHVRAVSLKTRDGDDASCLNLNRAQAPRLLGVDPAAMAARGAFAADGAAARALWDLLQARLPDDTIPGLAGDGNTAQWGLQKRVGVADGDTLTYRDERGNEFRVRLVGKLPLRLSVFQGSVLIAQDAFARRYPSDEGYRTFLFDVPAGADVAAVRKALATRLTGIGLDVTPAVDRLREFYAVEQTYLNIFLVLGGLGLLLGSVGLGSVVLRNVLERRSELALLRCLGFSRRRVLQLVLAEHAFLLLAGMGVGGAAALVAIWPNLRAPGVAIPLAGMAALFVGVLAAGAACIVAAARLGLKGTLLNALRNE